MRIVLLGVALVGLAGCAALEREEIQNCEAALLAGLKSPATYKAVEKTSILIADAKRRYQSVSIKYDAQNSYGALLRDEHHCVYPVDGNDVRTDLGGDLGDALQGRGYFSPRAKLPTRGEREKQREAEIADLLNRTDETLNSADAMIE